MNITPKNAIQNCAAICLAEPGRIIRIARRILNKPLYAIKAQAARAGVNAIDEGEHIAIVAEPMTPATWEDQHEALYADHYAS